MIRKYAILNFVSVIVLLVVNFLAQTKQFNGISIGEVSAKYSNLFTPAGYAFSIWGLIFLSLLVFSGYMIYQAYHKEANTDFIKNTSFWFIIANVATSLWVIAWVFEYLAISVILMFLILLKLLKIILNNNMEKWDAPFKVIAFYWWPICLYSGWISVALIANMASYLTYLGWDGTIFSETDWTLIMIAVAAAINLLMLYLRNMREYAAVGVWALFAIYIRHSSNIDIIANTALAATILLILNISYHGYINRKSNPLYRMLH